MAQNLLTNSSTERMEMAIAAIQAGNGVLLIDDENRENEGDLIFSAENLTNKQMARLIRDCSGIVCLCLTEEKLKKLKIPQMVENNTCVNETGFTITIEAKNGVSTGVSAADRVTTIKTAIAENCQPTDLAHPGHVFPLRARKNGVLERGGHTEGTVDLMKIAGLKSAGVLCELTNPDGTMARLPEIIEYSNKYNFPVLTIEDIIKYRQNKEN